ncbi:proline-rich protein 36-like [Schistocerca serialis cubense]|uniref:proline-rich protein 36-like n=1 Tax=Schistocerca serialis cubense TaxID=2023355 RepID=UPI00214E7622|nr:proline-rich protein 36-like [Schistocerca serialis cubense]
MPGRAAAPQPQGERVSCGTPPNITTCPATHTPCMPRRSASASGGTRLLWDTTKHHRLPSRPHSLHAAPQNLSLRGNASPVGHHQTSPPAQPPTLPACRAAAPQPQGERVSCGTPPNITTCPATHTPCMLRRSASASGGTRLLWDTTKHHHLPSHPHTLHAAPQRPTLRGNTSPVGHHQTSLPAQLPTLPACRAAEPQPQGERVSCGTPPNITTCPATHTPCMPRRSASASGGTRLLWDTTKHHHLPSCPHSLHAAPRRSASASGGTRLLWDTTKHHHLPSHPHTLHAAPQRLSLRGNASPVGHHQTSPPAQPPTLPACRAAEPQPQGERVSCGTPPNITTCPATHTPCMPRRSASASGGTRLLWDTTKHHHLPSHPHTLHAAPQRLSLRGNASPVGHHQTSPPAQPPTHLACCAAAPHPQGKHVSCGTPPNITACPAAHTPCMPRRSTSASGGTRLLWDTTKHHHLPSDPHTLHAAPQRPTLRGNTSPVGHHQTSPPAQPPTHLACCAAAPQPQGERVSCGTPPNITTCPATHTPCMLRRSAPPSGETRLLWDTTKHHCLPSCPHSLHAAPQHLSLRGNASPVGHHQTSPPAQRPTHLACCAAAPQPQGERVSCGTPPNITTCPATHTPCMLRRSAPPSGETRLLWDTTKHHCLPSCPHSLHAAPQHLSLRGNASPLGHHQTSPPAQRPTHLACCAAAPQPQGERVSCGTPPNITTCPATHTPCMLRRSAPPSGETRLLWDTTKHHCLPSCPHSLHAAPQHLSLRGNASPVGHHQTSPPAQPPTHLACCAAAPQPQGERVSCGTPPNITTCPATHTPCMLRRSAPPSGETRLLWDTTKHHRLPSCPHSLHAAPQNLSLRGNASPVGHHQTSPPAQPPTHLACCAAAPQPQGERVSCGTPPNITTCPATHTPCMLRRSAPPSGETRLLWDTTKHHCLPSCPHFLHAAPQHLSLRGNASPVGHHQTSPPAQRPTHLACCAAAPHPQGKHVSCGTPPNITACPAAHTPCMPRRAAAPQPQGERVSCGTPPNITTCPATHTPYMLRRSAPPSGETRLLWDTTKHHRLPSRQHSLHAVPRRSASASGGTRLLWDTTKHHHLPSHPHTLHAAPQRPTLRGNTSPVGHHQTSPPAQPPTLPACRAAAPQPQGERVSCGTPPNITTCPATHACCAAAPHPQGKHVSCGTPPNITACPAAHTPCMPRRSDSASGGTRLLWDTTKHHHLPSHPHTLHAAPQRLTLRGNTSPVGHHQTSPPAQPPPSHLLHCAGEPQHQGEHASCGVSKDASRDIEAQRDTVGSRQEEKRRSEALTCACHMPRPPLHL